MGILAETIQVELIGGSFLLDWGPIILSVVAVIVAVLVPIIIAKKQNQIAVFDKLFVSYSQLLLVKSFAGTIQESSFTGELREIYRARLLFCTHFETSFGYHPDLNDFNHSIGCATAVLRKNEIQAYMLPMLISKNEKQKKECSEMVEAIYEPLFILTVQILSPRLDDKADIGKLVNDLAASCNAFFNKYSDIIEKLLLCNK